MADDSEDKEFVARTLVDFYFSHAHDDSWCIGSGSLMSHIESYRHRRPVPNGNIMDTDGDKLMAHICKIHKQKKDYDLEQIRKQRKIPDSKVNRKFEMCQANRRREIAAEKNARELIQEEEEAKLKAKKKKEKKDRQNQKKTEIKPQSSKKAFSDMKENTGAVDDAMENLNLGDDVEQVQLEEKSAFLSKAIKKVENQPVINNKPKSKNVQEPRGVEPMIIMALDLIENQEYKEAIQPLSEAIILAPTRVDLLLKRSLVYFEIAKYKKSLRDAENSLKIHPFNPEGHYRLGEAHSALNNYSEADAAFSKIAHNSTYEIEVKEKLFSLRIKQLVDMGYDSNESFTALLKSENQSLDEAIDFLTKLQNGTVPTDDLYYSDESSSESLDGESSEEEEEKEEEESKEEDVKEENNEEAKTTHTYPSANTVARKITIRKKSPLLLDPSNPFCCFTLFVVGMKKDITAQEVQDVFAKFGDIHHIKLVTVPKVYAFVNYVEWQTAGQAMQALQGSRWLLSTTKALIIKYPVNLVNEMISRMKNHDAILAKLGEAREAGRWKYRPKPTNHFRPHPVNSSRSKPASTFPKPAGALPKPAGAFPKPAGALPKPAFRLDGAKAPPAQVLKSKNVSELINHAAPSKFPVIQHVSNGKPRPSPKTEECYFWRNTGCNFGKKCFNLHVPNHKGIALKEKFAKFLKEN